MSIELHTHKNKENTFCSENWKVSLEKWSTTAPFTLFSSSSAKMMHLFKHKAQVIWASQLIIV